MNAQWQMGRDEEKIFLPNTNVINQFYGAINFGMPLRLFTNQMSAYKFVVATVLSDESTTTKSK